MAPNDNVKPRSRYPATHPSCRHPTSPDDMLAINRSAGRDVHIYDVKDPNTALGGLILTNGVTNANFYSMIEIFCIFDSVFFLRDEGGTVIQRDGDPLRPSKYYILTDGM